MSHLLFLLVLIYVIGLDATTFGQSNANPPLNNPLDSSTNVEITVDGPSSFSALEPAISSEGNASDGSVPGNHYEGFEVIENLKSGLVYSFNYSVVISKNVVSLDKISSAIQKVDCYSDGLVVKFKEPMVDWQIATDPRWWQPAEDVQTIVYGGPEWNCTFISRVTNETGFGSFYYQINASSPIVYDKKAKAMTLPAFQVDLGHTIDSGADEIVNGDNRLAKRLTQEKTFNVFQINYDPVTKSSLKKNLSIISDIVKCEDCYANLDATVRFVLEFSSTTLTKFEASVSGDFRSRIAILAEIKNSRANGLQRTAFAYLIERSKMSTQGFSFGGLGLTLDIYGGLGSFVEMQGDLNIVARAAVGANAQAKFGVYYVYPGDEGWSLQTEWQAQLEKPSLSVTIKPSKGDIRFFIAPEVHVELVTMIPLTAKTMPYVGVQFEENSQFKYSSIVGRISYPWKNDVLRLGTNEYIRIETSGLPSGTEIYQFNLVDPGAWWSGTTALISSSIPVPSDSLIKWYLTPKTGTLSNCYLEIKFRKEGRHLIAAKSQLFSIEQPFAVTEPSTSTDWQVYQPVTIKLASYNGFSGNVDLKATTGFLLFKKDYTIQSNIKPSGEVVYTPVCGLGGKSPYLSIISTTDSELFYKSDEYKVKYPELKVTATKKESTSTTMKTGESMEVSLTSSLGATTLKVNIELWGNYLYVIPTKYFEISLNVEVSNNFKYDFIVPNSLSYGSYWVKVYVVDCDSIYGESSYVKIDGSVPVPSPVLTLDSLSFTTTPRLSNVTISWTSSSLSGDISVYVTNSNWLSTSYKVGTVSKSLNSFTWLVSCHSTSYPSGSGYYFELETSGISKKSSSFSISGWQGGSAPTISITQPASGTTWKRGGTYNIKWSQSSNLAGTTASVYLTNYYWLTWNTISSKLVSAMQSIGYTVSSSLSDSAYFWVKVEIDQCPSYKAESSYFSISGAVSSSFSNENDVEMLSVPAVVKRDSIPETTNNDNQEQKLFKRALAQCDANAEVSYNTYTGAVANVLLGPIDVPKGLFSFLAQTFAGTTRLYDGYDFGEKEVMEPKDLSCTECKGCAKVQSQSGTPGTSNDAANSTSNSGSSMAAVGGVVAGILIVLIAGAVVYSRKERNKVVSVEESPKPKEPNTMDSPEKYADIQQKRVSEHPQIIHAEPKQKTSPRSNNNNIEVISDFKDTEEVREKANISPKTKKNEFDNSADDDDGSKRARRGTRIEANLNDK